MARFEYKFQQFEFGSSSTLVITNESLEKVRVRKLMKLNLKIIIKLLGIDKTKEFSVGSE